MIGGIYLQIVLFAYWEYPDLQTHLPFNKTQFPVSSQSVHLVLF